MDHAARFSIAGFRRASHSTAPLQPRFWFLVSGFTFRFGLAPLASQFPVSSFWPGSRAIAKCHPSFQVSQALSGDCWASAWIPGIAFEDVRLTSQLPVTGFQPGSLAIAQLQPGSRFLVYDSGLDLLRSLLKFWFRVAVGSGGLYFMLFSVRSQVLGKMQVQERVLQKPQDTAAVTTYSYA